MPPVATLPPGTILALDDLEDVPAAVSGLRGCALTVGNFDGVHRGHQWILDRLVREAADGQSRVAVTFEPHPVRFFRPDAAPFRLTTAAQKLLLLRHYGVDEPVVLQFDRSLSELEPEAFVRSVLWSAFEPSLVVVGYDFNFGKNRRGDPDLLLDELSKLGARGVVQEAVGGTDGVVSSTLIREALRAGDVARARRLLGRPLAVLGRVVHGDARGRALGFPTANLLPLNELLPAYGVYATLLEVGDDLWRAITNIGVRPTFGGGAVNAETFVLDERAPKDIDLYDRAVAVHLIGFIREERTFPSPKELVAQIQQDLVRCREILANEAAQDLVRQTAAVTA